MVGILIITDTPPPSGSVIGGTLLGVLALVVLVTALGCLIYYKRRKGRKLNRRYQFLLNCFYGHTFYGIFMSCKQRLNVLLLLFGFFFQPNRSAK